MNFDDKTAVAKLIEGCAKGDRKSQHTLYKAFYGKMLSVCARYASNYDEAKDLLHDGFIKVFNKLESFGNKGSFEGWIRRIMVNNAIDFVRAKRDFIINKEDTSLFDNIPDDSDNEIEVQQFIQVKAETILGFVQKLSPAYRTVFNMYVIENYSHKEIAEQLNISVGSSKSNLAKAKMKLKEMFENNLNGNKKEFERF